jgi:hypothetical protein
LALAIYGITTINTQIKPQKQTEKQWCTAAHEMQGSAIIPRQEENANTK